jgi:hypothetical protein
MSTKLGVGSFGVLLYSMLIVVSRYVYIGYMAVFFFFFLAALGMRPWSLNSGPHSY